ncbi:hypothetical protein AKJ58_01590, partial [candidate division MSBL1 archaeon SCGC-AAA385D11]
MKVISLFSGAGGLDLGFKKAGVDIVYANDIQEDFCETYKNNIGNEIVCENIKDFHTSSTSLNSLPSIIIGEILTLPSLSSFLII